MFRSKCFRAALLALLLFCQFLTPALAADTSTDSTWVDPGIYAAPTQFDSVNKIVTITTPAELGWVSYVVMNGNTLAGYTIRLANDIDLSGHLWQPIGGWNGKGADISKQFSGTFDGQGHEIKNMTIDRANLSYNGLFGYTSGAVIRNVLLTDFLIRGDTYTGGLIGSNNDDSLVTGCGVSGNISGSSAYVGGLIGYGYEVVFISCYSRVELQPAYVGQPTYPFSGYRGTSLNCWYDADKCPNAPSLDEASYIDCYAITEESLETTDYVAQLNQFLVEDAPDWVEGEDGWPTLGSTYSRAWCNNTTPVTEQDGYYYINTAEELAYIAELVNSGNDLRGKTVKLMSDIDLSGKHWTPIGVNSTTLFSGTFDGSGKTISGLYANFIVSSYGGLFGYVYSADRSGVICDVTLENPVMDLYGFTSYIGTIAGYNYADILNCHVINGHISGKGSSIRAGGIVGYMSACTISNCSFQGYISAGVAGGIAAEASSTIEKCHTSGTIIAQSYAGGISGGWASVRLSNCYSSCTVTSTGSSAGGLSGTTPSYARYCYSIGNISGISDSGLLFGGSNASANTTISGCYWLDSASLTLSDLPATPVGMPGTDLTESLTLAEMQKAENFEGYDFNTIWAIDPDKNGGLPYLHWQTEVPEVITPTSISVTPTSLSLEQGSTHWLIPTLSPANANAALTWESSASTVATVRNGQVVALQAGTAIITVRCGTLSAACTVTVQARPDHSYELGDFSLTDESGTPLSEIPQGTFWASIPLTKKADTDDAVVTIAAYSANGQYLRMYAMSTNLPVGYTSRFRVLIDNQDGSIARLRAFTLASLSVPLPLSREASIE